MGHDTATRPVPAAGIATSRMPGHWLLAKLGKRVLRPGGLETTQWLLETLRVGGGDRVLELAPGLGATARRLLAAGPKRYTAVDRDEDAVRYVKALLAGTPHTVTLGHAHETGLEDGSVDVVIGEAMLTMNPIAHKRKIVAEAYRVLAPGGRYAIHELSLVPDALPEAERQRIDRDLSSAIHVGAKPLPVAEWRALMEEAGFVVETSHEAPMHLLELKRVVADEGVWRTLRILFNVLRDQEALERVLEMRGVFRRHQAHIGAIALVARKPNP